MISIYIIIITRGTMKLYSDVYWYVGKVDGLFGQPRVVSWDQYFQLREEGRDLQKRCREDKDPISVGLRLICKDKMCQLFFAMKDQQVFLLEGAHTLLSLIKR